MFNMLKKKRYILSTFQKEIQIVKKVNLLMIPNGEGWHYIAIKMLTVLLRGITSKHHVDFYCLNCLHSFRTDNKLESHKKVCENFFL